jgi:hypothetical protein
MQAVVAGAGLRLRNPLFFFPDIFTNKHGYQNSNSRMDAGRMTLFGLWQRNVWAQSRQKSSRPSPVFSLNSLN